jgi:hypothetical protein
MPHGSTYFGLLAALRQSELLDEAAQRRRAREHQARRRSRILSLVLPHLRRQR